MPADPSVSPADTPKNPGATIAEVLLLTEGYLDDGYGEADLRERMAKARPALDALLAVGERDTQELDSLRKLYGAKFNAIGAALGRATEAQVKLESGDVDAAEHEIAKVVSILVDA